MIIKRLRLNLKQKVIIISIVCSLLPLTVLGIINFYNIHNLLVEKAAAKYLSLGKLAESKVKDYFARVNEDLYYLANMQDTKLLFQDSSKKYYVKNNLLHFAFKNSKYELITILDLTGQEIVKISNDKYPKIVANKDLKNLAASSKFAWIKEAEPFVSLISPFEFEETAINGEVIIRTRIKLVISITNIYGEESGYLVLDVKVNPLIKEFYELQQKYPNLYIVSEDGNLLFHPEIEVSKDGSIKGQASLTLNNEIPIAKESLLNTGEYTTLTTKETIIASYPFTVSNLNDRKLSFIMSVNRLAFLQPLKDFYVQFVFAGLCLAFLLTVVSYYLSRKITSPLVKLSEAIDRVAVGNFRERIEENTKDDEIENLIVHFNQMIDKLNILYENLEEKVKERTKKLADANQEMTRLAITDPLTGLYNRHFFQAYIDQQVEVCKRYNKKLTIIIADVDDFKQINDKFGHNTGDQVLQVIAHLLKESVRASDIIIRYGGDEFLIILMDNSSDGDVKWQKRFQLLLEEWNTNNSNYFNQDISLSFGFSQFTGTKSIEEVIKEADKKMYDQKSGKKD